MLRRRPRSPARASNHPGYAFAKLPPRRIAREAAQRREQAVKRRIRQVVAKRDGRCRLKRVGTPFGPCAYRSEWCHVNEYRRSKTTGRAPDARHTTSGTMMLCENHHDDIDEHRMEIVELTARGADGPLEFRMNGIVYRESEQ